MKEPTESELVAGFVQWLTVNKIPIHNDSQEEIDWYMLRYLMAAG